MSSTPVNDQLGPRLRPVREVIRDEHSMKAPILRALGDGPLTIPQIAAISKTACKGCGGCVPVCPSDAIDLQGYTDAQIRAMIDGMLEVVCA